LTRDEQKSITQLISRAVTGLDGAALPPLDIEADTIIRALFVRYPEAAYRVTMLAVGLAQQLEMQRQQQEEAQARKNWLSRLLNPLPAPQANPSV
jgi:hypothetical protein